MASKLQFVTKLLEDEKGKVAGSYDKWTHFLKTASNNFKYGFNDQVLIYAQRPDATACAEISFWNEKMNRWVNRGAKGIALLDHSGNGQKLRYVFDVSDTNSFYGYELTRWKVKDEYHDEISEALINAFGDVAEGNLESVIDDTSRNMAFDNIQDYLSTLEDGKIGSFLEELDEDNLSVAFRNVIASSVGYMMMQRCGINADDFYDQGDFEEIYLFNTPQTVTSLGVAVSDIAEMGLREIESTVKNLKKNEKKRNRTFENIESNVYDDSEKEKTNAERSNENVTVNLQTSGRLSNPEPDATERGERYSWEVRYDAEEISDGKQESVFLESRIEGDFDENAERNRDSGSTDDGKPDRTDDENARSNGEAERKGSDEMGSAYEQHQMLGGGNRTERTHLQLSNHNFNDGWNGIDYYSNDKEKNEIIKSFLTPHINEIAVFYESHFDKKERSDYLLSLFDSTAFEQTLSNGVKAGFEAYSDAIRFWRGDRDTPEKEAWERWFQVERSVYGMILLEQWTQPKALLLPGMDSQIEFVGDKVKDGTLHLPQAAIDYILSQGSNVSEGKMRIYRQFSESLSKEDNIRFLKNEYGTGGHSDAIPGSGYWESHDSKGIEISDHYSVPERRTLLKWNYIEKRISELIRLDRYLNPKEKEMYPQWLEARMEKEAEWEEQNRNKEISSSVPPEETKEYVYEYHLGDTVFIGADEYTVLSIDDNDVTLNDSKYPIFSKDFSREVFERKVKENPANNHLRVEVKKEERSTEKENSYSPIYQEYLETKADNPESMLLFQVGDFYEAFNEDAKTLSKELDLVLTTRDTGNGERVPMAGIPRHTLEGYINRLNDRGIDVAVCSLENGERKTVQYFSEKTDFTNDYPKVEIEESSFILKKQEKELDIAKQLINEYCQKEFLQDADFSDLSSVGLAFTTVGDAEIETQINANLIELSIDRYLGNELVDKQTFNSMREMCDALETLDFNELTYFTDEQIEQAENRGKQSEELLAPPPEKKVRQELNPYVLYPEIKSDYRTNFVIDNDEIGAGTPLERFRHNIMAIQLLHKLEDEHRLADTNEQRILSDYVGWGGLADFFNEDNPHFNELRVVMNDEEFNSARESTLTAFYTPPVVIKSIYQALKNMGFKNGNILEPSCGIGNFMGLIPDSMSESKIYGVELDSLTGRMAQQLYQRNNIAIQGYENTDLPDSFFDAAIGNVPFGQFKVSDKRYDKNNWQIHDYFFGKTLDKVRPGGVIAFITSSWTLDKKNPSVRKYIAQRADLLGAIRLPNNTFKANAGTDVTTDIVFLQKRDTLVNEEPDWVYLDRDENGNEMNKYFVDHPEMILGEMVMESSQYGQSLTCKPYEGRNLSDLLSEAIQNIHAEIPELELPDIGEENDIQSIPADPNVRNFSFTVVDDKIYFRENSRMNLVDVSQTAENRIKGMIRIRDCVRELIQLQTDDYPESSIKSAQDRLNALYDAFTKKYGLLNSRANKMVFSDDSSYSLLCSLEVIGENGELLRKADMFSKRTIKPHIRVTSVDTASEALAVSIGEKARVDMEYMCELTGKTEQELFEELKGVIFLNPEHTSENDGKDKYLSADEYLSGNVRQKLDLAKRTAQFYPEDYNINVEMLEKIQPADLSASEISVRLGATWLPTEDVEKFMYELLQTPRYAQWNIKVKYSERTCEWNVQNKTYDRSNIMANSTYGTDRINAYKIIEETLNLKDVRIFDYVDDMNGNRKPVLNKKETAIAQGKQEMIKQAFCDWIWKDPERRERLVRRYNDLFNSMRAREYDGSHIVFSAMNPEITLRPHQINAVARIMYGGNTLLAHVVGAGKTFEIVAAAQESKRLGLCNKSLIVVPNHLTEQWASEYLQLYPSANILVATKKDFETKNRKKFCARIATGDYDAVIIGHSQFEKIPISIQRQKCLLQKEIDDITEGIAEIKYNRGERFTVKQLEKTKKSLQSKLDKLNDQSRKDDVVTFEELGVDRLFVDEAHYFKNRAKRCV